MVSKIKGQGIGEQRETEREREGQKEIWKGIGVSNMILQHLYSLYVKELLCDEIFGCFLKSK